MTEGSKRSAEVPELVKRSRFARHVGGRLQAREWCVNITSFFCTTPMLGRLLRLSGLMVAPVRVSASGRAELFGTIPDPSAEQVSKAKVKHEDQATMVRLRRAPRTNKATLPYPGTACGSLRTTVAHRDSAFSPVRITLRPGRPSTGDRCETRDRPAFAIGRGDGGRAAPPNRQREVSLHIEEKKIVNLAAGWPQLHNDGHAVAGVAIPNGSFLTRLNGSAPTKRIHIRRHQVLQPGTGQVGLHPIVDGMAEFKMNVNAYSPEYGCRSNGGM